MVILIALLISLVVLFISVIASKIFKAAKGSNIVRAVATASLTFSIVFGVLAMILAMSFSNQVCEARAEFENLVLYADIVEETDNEYVRFDFYNQVNEYNETRKNLIEGSETWYFGALFPRNCRSKLLPLEFSLRDGNVDKVTE
jgi:hypothetical protein